MALQEVQAEQLLEELAVVMDVGAVVPLLQSDHLFEAGLT
jgi:hypothetical protein